MQVAAAARPVFSEVRFFALKQILTELTNIQGGYERICNTPLPRQYDYYPELFVYLYCFLLPLSLTDGLGIFAPGVTLILGFVFLVLNRIGKNLEDPFSFAGLWHSHDVVEPDNRDKPPQQLGEQDVPPFPVPREGVLI